MVRQRLRPERIDLEPRRLERAATCAPAASLEHVRSADAERRRCDARNADPISRSRFARSSSLDDELLQALALEVLARVDVALRVHRDAADAVERARPAAAAAEARRRSRACRGRGRRPSDPGRRRRNRKRCCGSLENAMSHTEPSPRVVFDDERFLHERAVLPEHLDAIVAAIADVDQAVLRDLDAADGAELLRGRRRRIVRRRRRPRPGLAPYAPQCRL